MKIAVLCNPDSWYFRDLSRAASERGHEIQSVSFSDLHVTIGGETSPSWRQAPERLPLESFDVVMVRTMPPGSLEQVVFRMDALGQLQAAGVHVINSPRAIEIAVDKFLTSALLQREGLPTPRTIVCQTADQAMEAFVELGQDVVVKPLFGGEGRGITRIEDEAMMLRAAKMLPQLGAVLYLQQFIPHRGRDQRVFVLGERLYGMQRVNENDWRTNVSRGARTEPLAVADSLAATAVRAARAVQAELAGVDLLEGDDGQLWVLEVNAVPGWKALGRTLGVDIAAEVVEHLALRVGGV